MNQKITFSILITTKNRLPDLRYTLEKISLFLHSPQVECVIYDDGSSDGTSHFIQTEYPGIALLRNEKSKGYMYCRNRLLNETSASYAISLDDDAHILSDNALEIITAYFEANPKCGNLAARIFWGTAPPIRQTTKESSEIVKGFVGCGHVWNMKAWKSIPNYPEWFVFYGEEEFAAYQLFKNGWEVHYVPDFFVHHRADIKSRKGAADYRIRQRRSFRSGWYLFFIFFPWFQIPRRLLYTFIMQMKNKFLKGDFKATLGVFQAVGDVVYNMPKLVLQSNRFTSKEFERFEKLPNTKIYWKPENDA